MPPIDPRVVKAKRFPVHAAVDRCNGEQIVKLLEEDAPFHIVRKIPDVELSVSCCLFMSFYFSPAQRLQ